MDFLNTLDDNSILIIPNNIKEKVLNYIDQNKLLINIKLLTFNEIKKSLFFDYDLKTIDFIMNTYKVTYDISTLYLENLYYIDKTIKNNKMQFLIELKNNLDKHNLLIYDKLFKYLLKNKNKIYVFGYKYLSKYENYILDKLKEYNTVEIINSKENNYKHTAIELNTMNDEVLYICENISMLIKDGISPDKIYISGYSDEYYFTFKRIINSYKLPITLKTDNTLYKTTIGKYFLDHLSNDLNKCLYELKKHFKYEENQNNANVINKLQNLLNKFYFTKNILDNKKLLIEEMKKVRINSKHYENEINITSIDNNIFYDDEYVFLMGFNLGNIPKIKKDEDYLDDSIKPTFLDNTNDTNELNKNKYLYAIRNIKNLTITYKLSSPFSNYTKSYLIDDDYIKLEHCSIDYLRYSDEQNKLLLAKLIDNKIKFNEDDNNLPILNNNYKIDYQTYSHEYSSIDSNELKKTLDNKLIISYSNISNYFDCPFKFYLSSILKVKEEYKVTLDQFIGKLFHYVLENTLENQMSVDEAYDKYIKDNIDSLEDTYMNKYFLSMLKDEIKIVRDIILEQYNYSEEFKSEYEKEILIPMKHTINYTLKGFVDKLLLINNDAIIIDYKTNKKDIDKRLLEYGIYLQLPIYLYMLKYLDKDIKVAGIYLQHILDVKLHYKENQDNEKVLRDNLRLRGLTLTEEELISKFDSTYDKSKVIFGLSTKDGEIKNTKWTITKDEQEKIIKLVENLLNKAIDNICDANFPIKPLYIKNTHDGCQYCKYQDICFKESSDYDIKYIQESGDEDE